MGNRNAKLIGGFAVLASSLWIFTAVGEAQTTINVNCGVGATIASVLAKNLRPGSTILVSGTCNENVIIDAHHLDITLDGQGTATISGPDATNHTIRLRGRGITIKNFASITGGLNGINVARGGSALIDSNTIQSTGNQGIAVITSSTARIVNNIIQNNPNNGIVVSEGASARIGILTNSDTVASPNTIQNNSNRGINVRGHSTAKIVGNTISGNLSDGVLVNEVSQADLASNVISNNGGTSAGYGINFGRNSGVNLGNDTGTTIFDLPNSGTGNALFGIRCFINSYGDGRQGTLTGNSGAVDFTSTSCINSLVP